MDRYTGHAPRFAPAGVVQRRQWVPRSGAADGTELGKFDYAEAR